MCLSYRIAMSPCPRPRSTRMGYIFLADAFGNDIFRRVMNGGIYFGWSTFENHNISPGGILSGNNSRNHLGEYIPSDSNADGRRVRDTGMGALLSYRIGK